MLDEFARQIVETVPDGMLILDEKLRVQVANRSFYQTFEVSPEATDGRFIYDLGNGEWNIPELRHVLEEILPQNKTVESFEVEHDFPDIGLRVMLLNARQVHQHEAGSSFILLVISDITERRKIERALATQVLELARFNEFARQIVETVPDAMLILDEKLRVQVANRSFYQTFEVSSAATDGRFIYDLGNGEWNIPELRHVLEDILPQNSIPVARIDFNTVLERTLANLEMATRESGCLITHDTLPTLVADASQLGQVFLNLIGNAIKFRGAAPLQIHVSAVAQEDAWLFSICDNGIGFEPEFSERIFVIFQRLHSREEYSGTGIGLAICKKIIEGHRGHIWVESQPGAGSTFYFTLPSKGGS